MTRPGVDPSDDLTVQTVLGARASSTRMILRGCALRCPRCGSRNIFRRWVHMAENCPGCGYRFDRGDDGFFLGAYTVNLCVNETVIFAALMFMVLGGSSDSAASAWPILVAMLAGAVLLPIFFYPFSKTLWCAVYLASDPLELNEIVDAIDALGRAGAAAPEAIADGSPAAPKESEPDPGRR